MSEAWTEYKFKEVATAVKGKLPKNKNEVGVGVPYLTANYLRTNEPDYWIENHDGAVTADEGDCLILWDGAGAGDLFTAKHGVVSSTMAVVTTEHPDINRNFFTLLISSKADYIKETCRGTTVPHVSPDALSNMVLAIPPLNSQKRIVDLISSIDAYIEALRQQLASAAKSREAVLHELLTAGGVDWADTTFGDMADWSSGKYLEKDFRVDDGIYPVIGANGEIGKTNRYLYDQPLVIVGRVGSCGETYVSEGKVWISDNALIAAPRENVIVRFLYLLLKTFDYREIISGTTQPLITQGKLKVQTVPLPPLSEQKRIVEVISSMDDVASALEQTKEQAKILRSGLLADLLSGEHEIPANYDDARGADE